MCGVAGLFDPSIRTNAETLRQICGDMADRLRNRGPDDAGVWIDPEAGIALGHRRLSVIDVSPAGHQPMVSASGRTVIVYNGEVYNFSDLRRDLEAEGVGFRGHSDTEVILEGCERWGVAPMLERLNGMFAFALWDRHTRELRLVRDRIGIKPLYWGWIGETFVFGSELKALRRHPGFAADIDRDAVAAFLRYAYVPAPMSIYRGIRKLSPGCVLTVGPDRAPVEAAYWRMADIVREGQESRLELDDAEAVEQLETLLGDAVGRRMVADVPLGAFLSGGIDSSTVVALMQEQSERPVRSFSIGFHQPGYDEAGHAKAVADHLGLDHTELYVEFSQALDVIPGLAEMYDEPFADSSQIPTFLVSSLARSEVTVALSGDGGDELFAGYDRYTLASRIWRCMDWMPGPLRSAAAGLIHHVSPANWNRLFGVLPDRFRLARAGDRLHKLATVLNDGPDELYRNLISQWPDPDSLAKGGNEPPVHEFYADAARLVADPIERMQYLDTVTYLVDDILTKVDRASMAVSLEVRVPLLDHRLVEFAWRLPARFKRRDRQGKWLLRRVLERHVPRHLIDRPKMGFGVPLDSWLRGPLRDWAETLLAEDRLRAEGYLNPAPIRRRWQEHLSGERNAQYSLWTVLMFQAWLEEQAG